jgi:hypothetical protein
MVPLRVGAAGPRGGWPQAVQDRTMTPVRTLTAADLAPMREMLHLFGRAFEAPDTYTRHPPDDAYLQALLGSPTFVAVAAFDGTQVVGALTGANTRRC